MASMFYIVQHNAILSYRCTCCHCHAIGWRTFLCIFVCLFLLLMIYDWEQIAWVDRWSFALWFWDHILSELGTIFAEAVCDICKMNGIYRGAVMAAFLGGQFTTLGIPFQIFTLFSNSFI